MALKRLSDSEWQQTGLYINIQQKLFCVKLDSNCFYIFMQCGGKEIVLSHRDPKKVCDLNFGDTNI